VAALTAAFGAAFEVVEEDMRFMSRQLGTAAGTYETADGHLRPQYVDEVARRHRELQERPPGA
jgi:hypothetical protein